MSHGPGEQLKRLLGKVALGLLVSAVVQELRKPPEERTWVGEVAGFVPYDLRPPTVQRLLDSVWSPEDPRIFRPNAFGVGWTLNVGRLLRLSRSENRDAPAA